MNRFYKFLIHAILPLSLGGLIYISFRSTNLKMFSWFEILNIDSYIFIIRFKLIEYKVFFPSWFYFSLPDALWAYSFSSSILIFWINNLKIGKLFLSIPLSYIIFSEFLQLLEIIRGTFDILDLIISIIGIIISYKFIKTQILKDEKECIESFRV